MWYNDTKVIHIQVSSSLPSQGLNELLRGPCDLSLQLLWLLAIIVICIKVGDVESESWIIDKPKLS